MTAKEILIHFRLLYQNLGSQVNATFLPEQIQILVNNAALQFIENRTNPKTNPKQEGFEETQKRYDDVEELLERVTLPTYNEDTNVLKAFLPANYYKLASSQSKVKRDCSALTLVPSTKVLYICYVPFEDSADTFTDYKIIPDNGVGTIEFDINDYFETLDNGRKFELIPYILEELNKEKTIQCYWEKFGDLYKKGNFILISEYSISVDVIDDGDTTTYNGSATNFSQNNTLTVTSIIVPNRLIASNVLPTTLSYSFTKSIALSPITEIRKKVLYIYTNSTFTTESVVVTYIRKPRPVNFELDITCDINSNFHREIVAMAVEEAHAIANNNNNYQLLKEQNKILE